MTVSLDASSRYRHRWIDEGLDSRFVFSDARSNISQINARALLLSRRSSKQLIHWSLVIEDHAREPEDSVFKLSTW